ncbi:MAG TPA: TolC family protein [Terracidiphilus sp.]|nr:TolC family protein [Terracidiphilus sp.]
MSLKVFAVLVCLGFAAIATPAVQAQSSERYHALLTGRVASGHIQPPADLKTFVDNGKIRLSLKQAILLALENNSAIRVEESQIETQKFGVLAAHAAFDPVIDSDWNVNRYSSPTYSQLQGVGTSGAYALNTLTQTASVDYTQTFTTGTNVVASISSSKSSTNSSYNFFNPFFSSALSFQFTQPLLRNAGRFANTAPLIVARKSLDESRAGFEAEVNDAVLMAVNSYWAVVQARGALDVQQRSLQLAQKSYDHDKRALELGALPPLDINRSASEVAARNVQEIQTEVVLSQAEEALRSLIGADLDVQTRSMHFDLTENPEPDGALAAVDIEAALKEALQQRPETRVAEDALAIDKTNIRLAHNQLLPGLSFTGFYQSNGLGGNQYDLNTGQLTQPGGLGSSYSQLFGFGYPGYGGEIKLTLPVRNSTAQAQLGTALASRSRDLYSQRQTQEQIVRDVRTASLQLEAAKQAMTAAKQSLDLAKKSLAADQRKYELGAETNFFVLDSQTRLAQAELALLQTEVNYQVAVAAVEHATGKLLAPYQIQVDATMK